MAIYDCTLLVLESCKSRCKEENVGSRGRGFGWRGLVYFFNYIYYVFVFGFIFHLVILENTWECTHSEHKVEYIYIYIYNGACVAPKITPKGSYHKIKIRVQTYR